LNAREARDAQRLKVYALLVEGIPQSVVVQRTGFPKCNISKIASELLKDKIIEVKVQGKPIIYTKGKNGNILDKQILQRQVSVNASGVTQVSTGPKPKTTRVHHKKYRMNVVKVGEIDTFTDTINGQVVRRPFLVHHGTKYRNTCLHRGKVQYGDEFVTVEWMEGKNGTSTFFVYPPPMDLTSVELKAHKHDEIAIRICTEIAASIQAKAGWKFGLIEETQWKTHYGCDTPEVMRGLADKMAMRSKDGKMMLSDSDGRVEAEALNDPELAAIWLELPGEVIKLRGNFLEIAEGIRQINDVLQEVKSALETSTEISGILTSQQAQDVIQRVKKVKQETAAPQDVATASYDGVMYQ
jgi:hypothetical protein